MNDKLKMILKKPLLWITIFLIIIIIFIIKTIIIGPAGSEQAKKDIIKTMTLPESERVQMLPQQEKKIINLMTPKATGSTTNDATPSAKEKNDIFKAMSL